MLVPLAGALRTYFNHTTITTELRNFPLSVMTSSKILPTKQPGLPFSGPAGRRPSEEDTINSRQLIEQKWETLPRLIIPQRMITFLPPTRLFFYIHWEIPFIEKSRSVLLYNRLLLHEILSDHADDVRLPFLLLLLLIGYLDFCQSFPWLRDHLLSRKKIIHASRNRRNPISISSCSENANTILMDVARNFFPLQIIENFCD